MKIPQIAVVLIAFLLISFCRETPATATVVVKEKQSRQLVKDSNPTAIRNLIKDTSTEASLLALNVLHSKRSGNNGSTPDNSLDHFPDVQETDDDFQHLPPVDTYWLQNLKISLRQ
ncbi:hypothetical protein [Flavobacterium sp. WV_118_3]|uniref:hypothetical protein n=1 Tax=Flavobacterium sp. WV_118_3 TaxID=3151764 RepID=UPI0012C1F634|nr:hypothetical protein [Flavobacterium sp.]HRB71718.1 hypothetical protein [Flavobacterium sp.]